MKTHSSNPWRIRVPWALRCCFRQVVYAFGWLTTALRSDTMGLSDVKASGSPAHVPVQLPICRLGDVLRPTHGKPGKGQSGGEKVTSGTDHHWLKPKDKGMSDDNLAHCHRWSFGCRTVGCYKPCNVSLVHDRSLQNFQDWNYFESSVKRLLP